jgi:aminopeptidase N
LITVNDTDNGVTLTQHRMGYAGAETVEAQTWAVPVRFRWSTPEADQPLADRVLLDGPDPHPLDLPATTEWLVVNAAGTGFFRTSYATDRLNALAEQHSGDLTASERYALIDDTWSAVLADRSTTPAFLTLLEAMTAEEHRAVWLRMIGGFRQLSRLAGGGDAHDRLQEITHDALSPALAYLGLAPTEDDDDQRRQLRGDLVRALGTLANDGEIIDEARRTFAVGTRNPELVDAALMAAAVDIVAAHGDESDFDSIVAAWREATTPQDELRFLGALADFPDADQAATVHRMVSDGEVRSQNVPLLLRRALLNRQTGRDTWAFIAQEWDGVIASLSPGLVVRMLEGVTGLDLASDEKTVNDFFASHQVPAGERTLQQILEKQRVQVALREREADRLQRFLVS